MLTFASSIPCFPPPPRARTSAPALARPRPTMAAAPRAARANVLVTFDVDGTLLGPRTRPGASAHKRALAHAVHEVFGVTATVDSVPHAGSTDQEIVARMCVSRGVPAADAWARMGDVVGAACDRMPALVAEDELAPLVLPGVRALLAALAERGVYVGMVTGNFALIGWAKMERAGLGGWLAERLDQPSAFGSDRADRSEILKLAVERAEAQGFVKEEDRETGVSRNVFHVGDATADMAAARFVGCRGVGVLTGAGTVETLEPEKPFVVLENLADTQKILNMMGLV